jgi:hypothetical protein
VSPDELKALLNSMKASAEVVEAIDESEINFLRERAVCEPYPHRTRI